MEIAVRDNVVQSISGQKCHPYSKGFLCPKGLAAKEIHASPKRLKKPLRKVNSGWQEMSWDEALSLCAEKLQHIRSHYGPEALFVYHGQTYLKTRIAYFLMNRFLNLYGAVNISSAGSECFVSTMLAHFTTFGNLPFPDYEHSNCIMLWGANPCVSGGIGKSYPQMTRLFTEKKKNGAKFIVIDPRRTASAEFADILLQPRPGTDGALALGFIRAITDQQLHDSAYIEKNTSGFDKLRAMISDYPLEKVESITGIKKQVISDTARLFATSSPASIKVGSGLEHHTNGVQTIRAVNIILAITGNIDVKGGNTFLQVPQLAPPDVNIVKKDNALGAHDHPLFVSMVNQAHAVAALDKMLHDIPYPVRGMLVAGGSPLAVLPNSLKMQKVMDKMEFVVVIDQFMTETAKHAHLVLPTAMFLERDELSTNPLNLQRRILEPHGPWPDWKIWFELAHSMGYGEHFQWNSAEEIIEYMLAPTDFSLDHIRSTPGGIVLPQKVGKILNEGFYTYTGKIEIFSTSLESNGYDPLPHYHEPQESPNNSADIAATFPLVLTTGARYPVFVHSQQRDIESLRKHAPEPIMEIHPESAHAYDIADNEMVIVESPRGEVSVKASLTPGILPGVVHIPHGWSEANCNLLTDDTARDPISGFPGLKSSLCRISKKNTIHYY